MSHFESTCYLSLELDYCCNSSDKKAAFFVHVLSSFFCKCSQVLTHQEDNFIYIDIFMLFRTLELSSILIFYLLSLFTLARWNINQVTIPWSIGNSHKTASSNVGNTQVTCASEGLNLSRYAIYPNSTLDQCALNCSEQSRTHHHQKEHISDGPLIRRADRGSPHGRAL